MFYRNDYVVNVNADNTATVDVGNKEEWTHFAFELTADIINEIAALAPSKWFKTVLPSGDKVEAMYNVREGANQIFVVYKEKMFGGGYEAEHIAIERTDLIK
jgi:hypothetical protein